MREPVALPSRTDETPTRAPAPSAKPTNGHQSPPTTVCMHVLTVGRTDARVLREATALVEAGYRVTLVDLEKDASRPVEEDLFGVHFKHIVMPSRFVKSRFKPWFLVKMTRAVIRGAVVLARTPADIYHAHDDNALHAAYLVALLRGKPLIFDAHELPYVQPNITRWRTLCWMARNVLRVMMRRCSGVITVSPSIVDQIQQRYGGKRATLVRNIPPYTPPITSNRLREQLGCSPETRIALYQGAIQENRRLDILVRAAKYLSANQKIVLMGPGTSHRVLEALIAEEGVADRVHILPPVPYDELLLWTASADVGLSIFDGSFSLNQKYCLPNKLFEYLMAGVPVVASQLEDVVEILDHYDVGVTTPSIEPEAVGHTIAALLEDTTHLEQMRQNALVAARTELRWDVESTHLFGLYKEILPAPHPALAPVAR